MRKGEATRQGILRHAVRLGSRIGLSGLTIGRLADDLRLSKSGVFSHFRSKEALQKETIRFAASIFRESVIRPALREPRGEARVRALFERWLEWPKRDPLRGGCFFVAAASELDDRPGTLRDLLVELSRGGSTRWAGPSGSPSRPGTSTPGSTPSSSRTTCTG